MARVPRAGAALALLATINLLNFADRYVLGGVQELLKRDPGFSGGARDALGQLTDASLGTLTTMFVVVFMLASPITGWLGDRLPRKYLVAGGVLVWSAATLASGLAHSFGALLVARAFIGAGEAGYATVAPSLLADLYPVEQRGKALGLYNLVMPLGAAMGFALGGALGAAFSWRAAFLVSGVPGVLLAAMYLALPEPQRGIHDAADQRGSALGPVATLAALSRNRDFLINTGGQVLLTFTIGGLANWMPSFYARALGMGQAQAGTWFGALTAAAGILGTIAGTAAGEWAQRRHARGYFWVSGASLLASAPVVLLLSRAPGVAGTLAVTFAALFLVLFNGAPLYTALVNGVPASLRASAVAANLLAIHVLGDAISPPMLGALSDASGSLSVSVAACALPLALGGAVLLWGARTPAAQVALAVE